MFFVFLFLAASDWGVHGTGVGGVGRGGGGARNFRVDCIRFFALRGCLVLGGFGAGGCW